MGISGEGRLGPLKGYIRQCLVFKRVDVVRIRVFDWIYLIGRHANESPTSYSCFPGHLNQVRMRSYVPVVIDDCSIVLNGTKVLLLLKTLKY